jgi:hypothetical protein
MFLEHLVMLLTQVQDNLQPLDAKYRWVQKHKSMSAQFPTNWQPSLKGRPN